MNTLAQPPATPPSIWGTILDSAPVRLRRPLQLIAPHAYATAWVHLSGQDEPAVVILRDDGTLFTDATLPKATSIKDLGITVKPVERPIGTCLWSGAGVRRFLEGTRPAPREVFDRVVQVIDHFIDFSRDAHEQRLLAETVAAYTVSTYFLDAFPVMGYLWATGERGTGKTHLLSTVAGMAYLGHLLQTAGTLATLRDLADAGATLAFDEAETVMKTQVFDADKRALLLAGNRRGPR